VGVRLADFHHFTSYRKDFETSKEKVKEAVQTAAETVKTNMLRQPG
jgi:hypothetical protein